MSSKIIRRWKAFDEQPMSADADSLTTDLIFQDKGRIFITWEGGFNWAAEISIQISNDKIKWRTITPSLIPLSDLEVKQHEILFSQIEFGYLQISVVANGETTGTVNVELSASGKGA